MAKPRFPETILVSRQEDGDDDTFLLADEALSGHEDGPVAVYVLKKVMTKKTKLSLE